MSFFRTYKSVDDGVVAEGIRDNEEVTVKKIKYYGCDGQNHAEGVDMVDVNRSGKVVFAERTSREIKGDCDKTCSQDDLGFFSVP